MWIELIPFGCILLLAAWIFLRPLPDQSDEEKAEDSEDNAHASDSTKNDKTD